LKTDAKKEEGRMQLLLKPKNLDPQIQAELAPIKSVIPIPEQIRGLNRTAASLKTFRSKVNKENSPWSLEDRLLLYKGRLVVPVAEDDTLRAKLLKKMHNQPFMAHPGKHKLLELVRARYY
jgi:hypothetical protein